MRLHIRSCTKYNPSFTTVSAIPALSESDTFPLIANTTAEVHSEAKSR